MLGPYVELISRDYLGLIWLGVCVGEWGGDVPRDLRSAALCHCV